MSSIFNSLITSLGHWMFNPVLMMLGALAVLSPIIIHLLNKRKFRVIEWAAMDFLLQADRKNRRRVQLENLLLLLLRCLAVLLIGALLARPHFPTSVAGLGSDPKYDRVIILDDSLSMQTSVDGRSAMDDAVGKIRDLVNGFSDNGNDDWLTIYLTSNPDEAALRPTQLNDESNVADVMKKLDELEPSDQVASLGDALRSVEKSLDEEKNNVVYIISDMRESEWQASKTVSERDSLHEQLRKFADNDKLAACVIADIGRDETENLLITNIQPKEKALVAGVPTKFDVTVRNAGLRDVSDVQVTLAAGETIPQRGKIDSIPAGKDAKLTFNYTFSKESKAGAKGVRLRAEILSGGTDRLKVDDVRYHAARVVSGIPALIVDGDPSPEIEKSESFYLAKALAAPGVMPTGVDVKVVTDAEFDGIDLAQYRVIFLANLFTISVKRQDELRKWVEDGGGLVFLLGDKIDRKFYNAQLYGEGEGLLPVKLFDEKNGEPIGGDEREEAWVHFHIEDTTHDLLKHFTGEAAVFFEAVKIFRWWKTTPAESDDVTVVASFTDPDKSPAIVERPLGEGRVLVLTTAVDDDWNTWPQWLDSYLIVMQELVRYSAATSSTEGTQLVGAPIHREINLADFEIDATVEGPQAETVSLQALSDDNDDPSAYRLDFNETGGSGFYQLNLTRTDGNTESMLYAANIPPSEGNLQRVDLAELRRGFGDSKIRVVSGSQLASQAVAGSKVEFWKQVLIVLIVILALEQFLGWFFGRGRSIAT